MKFNNSIDLVIKKRISCRSFSTDKLTEEHIKLLENEINKRRNPFFKSKMRFILTAAIPESRENLKDLGTYGIIKNPAAFIIGAVKNGRGDMEDYGSAMEKYVLLATDNGIGSCWLGGSFKKSSFANAISAAGDETVPAVVALGYPEKRRPLDSFMRFAAGSDKRKPWQEIFFETSLSPLKEEKAGKYSVPLNMLRLSPSASNKQPWRIVKEKNNFHFYLERTPGYSRAGKKIFPMADLQRVDIGIAMCHFELAAVEIGLKGKWSEIKNREDKSISPAWEYEVTWSSVK